MIYDFGGVEQDIISEMFKSGINICDASFYTIMHIHIDTILFLKRCLLLMLFSAV